MKCKQHWKTKGRLQENLQEMLSRGRTKLRKVEPQNQELRKNMKAQKHGLRR